MVISTGGSRSSHRSRRLRQPKRAALKYFSQRQIVACLVAFYLLKWHTTNHSGTMHTNIAKDLLRGGSRVFNMLLSTGELGGNFTFRHLCFGAAFPWRRYTVCCAPYGVSFTECCSENDTGERYTHRARSVRQSWWSVSWPTRQNTWCTVGDVVQWAPVRMTSQLTSSGSNTLQCSVRRQVLASTAHTHTHTHTYTYRLIQSNVYMTSITHTFTLPWS